MNKQQLVEKYVKNEGYKPCENPKHASKGLKCEHGICERCHLEGCFQAPYWLIGTGCFYCIAENFASAKLRLIEENGTLSKYAENRASIPVSDWNTFLPVGEILAEAQMITDVGIQDGLRDKTPPKFMSRESSMAWIGILYQTGYDFGQLLKM